MAKLEQLERQVRELYEGKNLDRADWADWLYSDHVFLVADEAARLAHTYGANKEIAVAAAMLHDIADAVMKRNDPEHESRSLELAATLLAASEFTTDEINQIVTDILPNHSCRDGNIPKTLEGHVMASADAIVHLASNFYPVAIEKLQTLGSTTAEITAWVTEKIERDLHTKIFFDEERKNLQKQYKAIQAHVAAL